MAKNKKIKNRMSLAGRRAVFGYLFILPFVLGFLIFMAKPLIQSFIMSLSDVNVGANGFELTYTGLKNYERALTIDPNFNIMLFDEISKMVLNSLATIIFSFFIALLINQKFKGRAFVRAVFFLPVIFSSGVIVGLEYNNTLLAGMKQMIEESSTYGIADTLETILANSDLSDGLIETIISLVNSVYDIAIASGIQIIIFLSALQTIPKSMYEAADIEGCTKWESLWKITFPMISSMFLVNWIYTIIYFFMKSDNQVIQQVQTEVTRNLDFGYGSALAWIYFGIVIVWIGISSLIISRVVYYYE
ncbi:MAG: sugar ABC transporter permease [Lachnospiraceae bacterium]|nr:sugar ABC transporter permease [Lachnospiraceae bacterium]